MVSGLFDLSGRVAVVIGAAAGGLGERAAIALSEHGATVAVADLEAQADKVAETASRCGETASAHAVDVTSEDSVRALAGSVVDRHGRVDVVVNAAGIMLRREIGQTSLEEFEGVMRVNVSGCWLVGREFGPRLAASGWGRIVNVTTVYAERVGPVPESAYYASKAAVVNVTRSLGQRARPHRRHGQRPGARGVLSDRDDGTTRRGSGATGVVRGPDHARPPR